MLQEQTGGKFLKTPIFGYEFHNVFVLLGIKTVETVEFQKFVLFDGKWFKPKLRSLRLQRVNP